MYSLPDTPLQQNSYDPRYPPRPAVVRTSHVASIEAQQAALMARFSTQGDEDADRRKLLCSAFLLNHLGPNEFLDALAELKLLGSLGELLHAYARGVLAIEAERETQ